METPQQPQPEDQKVKKRWPTALVALGLGLASGVGISQADCSSSEPLGEEVAKDLKAEKLRKIALDCQQTTLRCIATTEKCIATAREERVAHDETIDFIDRINTKAGYCFLKHDFRKRMSCYYGKVSGPINKHIKKVRPKMQQF